MDEAFLGLTIRILMHTSLVESKRRRVAGEVVGLPGSLHHVRPGADAIKVDAADAVWLPNTS